MKEQGGRPATPGEVEAYYDSFSTERMARYRQAGNLRIDKAIARILGHVEPKSRILDVGCGVGIVTEALAKAAPNGHVLGIDISEQNIQGAIEAVKARNVTFRKLDAIEEFTALRELVPQPLDVIVLVDVIEHLPVATRALLLARLGELASPTGRLVLTYPSPQYQSYLMAEKPEELQIIDNIVTLDELLDETRRAGWHLLHYSLETVWMTNQYVHCVLAREAGLVRAAKPAKPGSRTARAMRKLKRFFERRLAERPRRR